MMKKLLYYIYPERFITVPYQISAFIISGSFILLVATKILFQFNPIEIAPKLQLITKDVIQEWGKEPIRVRTGLDILNFLTFDVIQNEFKWDLLIWFEYDPKKIDYAILDKFTFRGATRIDRAPPVFEDSAHGMKVVTHHLWLEFKSDDLLFRRFPLDDHMFFLELTNDLLKPTDLVYQVAPDDFKLFTEIESGGWRIINQTATVGFTKNDLSEGITDYRPVTLFSIGVSKEDVRHLFLILLPLLFLFYLSLFSFTLQSHSEALSSSQAAVAGMLGYSFVMQLISPKVGYFMLADFMFMLLLSCAFAAYLVNIGVVSAQGHYQHLKIVRFKGIMLIVLYAIIISAFVYMICYAELI